MFGVGLTRVGPRGGDNETSFLEPHGEDNRRGRRTPYPTRLVTPRGRRMTGSAMKCNEMEMDVVESLLEQNREGV